MNSIIVIPTFNERGNIGRLLVRLLGIEPRVAALVVDDNSADNTAEVVETLASRFPEQVHLMCRPYKLGLGSAYVDGFQRALMLGPFKYFVQMDGDLSHPPEVVAELIRRAEWADVVVGSRYMPGGSTSGWSPLRWLLSRGSAWLVRTELGLELSDPLGGFKCFTRSALERLDFERIRSKGFAFQLEMNWMCHQLGLTVAEVPIPFGPRATGRSKMSLSIMWEALNLIGQLKQAPPPSRLPGSVPSLLPDESVSFIPAFSEVGKDVLA